MVKRNMQVAEHILKKAQAAATSIPVLFITSIVTHILWLQTNMLKYMPERLLTSHHFLFQSYNTGEKQEKFQLSFQKGSLFLLTAV